MGRVIATIGLALLVSGCAASHTYHHRVDIQLVDVNLQPVRATVDVNSIKKTTNKEGQTHFDLQDADVWVVIYADGYETVTRRRSSPILVDGHPYTSITEIMKEVKRGKR